MAKRIRPAGRLGKPRSCRILLANGNLQHIVKYAAPTHRLVREIARAFPSLTGGMDAGTRGVEAANVGTRVGYLQGTRFTEVCHRLQRSATWLTKRIRRFRAEGWAGLAARPRWPHRFRTPTPAVLVARIVAVRRELEAHQTRPTRFRGVGAAEIQELLRLEQRDLPSVSTIERVLRRHHVRPKRARRRGGVQPYPHPRARPPAICSRPT